MTQKELIKAEIERRQDVSKSVNTGVRNKDDQFIFGQLSAYKGLLSFINSLPEEPVSKDLEELAISLEETIGTSPHSRDTIIEYFEKVAQWQKEQMIKSAITAHVFWRKLDKALWCFETDGDNLLIGAQTKVVIVKDE